jgi:hypothetical protein
MYSKAPTPPTIHTYPCDRRQIPKQLLDHVTTTHAAFGALKELAAKASGKKAEAAGREGTPYGFLNEHLLGMARAKGLPERKVGKGGGCNGVEEEMIIQEPEREKAAASKTTHTQHVCQQQHQQQHQHRLGF